jgi:alkaline phosphatase
VLEVAQQRGVKVGDVSTAEITDATPAVLASHISLRGCQGPATMAACPTETKAAGGLGSIAEQQVDHEVDVLLGGGRSDSSRPSPADRSPARPSCSRRRPRATSTSPTLPACVA